MTNSFKGELGRAVRSAGMRGIQEPPGVAAALEKTSPFRNGLAGQTGAKKLRRHKTNKRLAVVTTAKGDKYAVALPCEHLARAGVCRINCDEYKEAWTDGC